MTMVEKLEKAMQEKGLTKADLARGAGLPYTTVDGIWKKGSENAKRVTLVKLARFLSLSLDYLADDAYELTVNESEEDLNEYQAELLRLNSRLRKLPPEKLREIVNLIKAGLAVSEAENKNPR